MFSGGIKEEHWSEMGEQLAITKEIFRLEVLELKYGTLFSKNILGKNLIKFTKVKTVCLLQYLLQSLRIISW